VCAASVCLLLLAACASSRPQAPARMSQAQAEKCKELELAYRAGAAEYPALRDELIQDPIVVPWLTKMFVRDLITVREGRPLGEDQEFLAAAAKLELKVATRAIAEIETLGALAVPTLIDDLLRNTQAQLRELGIELLARVGQPAREPLLRLMRTGEEHEQRASARALGRIGVATEVFAALRELAQDGDFTVRADAVRALRTGGEPARLLLIERMQKDEDAFVRRTAASTLAAFPTTATALALVDFYDRCVNERDREGARAAQRALMELANTRNPRLPEQWRAWAPELDARAAARR
jgi:HEAT repeat protein